jgi:cytochrome P450
MAFLEEYDAIDSRAGGPAVIAGAKAQLVGTWLAQKPKELFDELRPNRPIFASPGLIFVTEHDDVLEVLSRDEVFSVRPYAPKMDRIAPTGFMLGMDNTTHYQSDVSVMRLAIRREDLPSIRAFIVREADDIMRQAALRGKLDMVQGLSRVVPARLVAHYFGVPGPDETTLMRWARTIFHDLFLNLKDQAEVRDPAVASGAEMRAYLDDLITARQSQLEAGDAGDDNVLNRLLRMQCNPATSFDNARIRDNLIGMIVGAIDTNSKAIAHAVDELLRRPAQLQAARQAALQDDDELLAHYIHESLRFNPQSIALVRFCERPYMLGKGTSHATLIPAGALVFAATWSAMFDPAYVDAPEEFRVDRSLDTDYLHFGYGLHSCFGRYISPLQILEVTKRLLRVEGLRRAPGPDGQVRYDGPFPDAFFVEFDGPNAGP